MFQLSVTHEEDFLGSSAAHPHASCNSQYPNNVDMNFSKKKIRLPLGDF